MPKEVKRPITLVTLVAVLGLLAQIVGGAILYGRTVGELRTGKADAKSVEVLAQAIAAQATVAATKSELANTERSLRERVRADEDKFSDHVAAQSRTEGELLTEVRLMRRDLTEIKKRLP